MAVAQGQHAILTYAPPANEMPGSGLFLPTLLESFAFLWRQKETQKFYNNVLSWQEQGSQMKGLLLCT